MKTEAPAFELMEEHDKNDINTGTLEGKVIIKRTHTKRPTELAESLQ